MSVPQLSKSGATNRGLRRQTPAHVPLRGLRYALRHPVDVAGPRPAAAHPGTPLRLHLARVQDEVFEKVPLQTTHGDSLRRNGLLVPPLQLRNQRKGKSAEPLPNEPRRKKVRVKVGVPVHELHRGLPGGPRRRRRGAAAAAKPETPQLPLLRPEFRVHLALGGAHSQTHRGATLQVSLAGMQSGVLIKVSHDKTRVHAHGSENPRVPRVRLQDL